MSRRDSLKTRNCEISLLFLSLFLFLFFLFLLFHLFLSKNFVPSLASVLFPTTKHNNNYISGARRPQRQPRAKSWTLPSPSSPRTEASLRVSFQALLGRSLPPSLDMRTPLISIWSSSISFRTSLEMTSPLLLSRRRSLPLSRLDCSEHVKKKEKKRKEKKTKEGI